ncbi:MAG: nodulation protein NfeD, partial [Chloroflexi bacterium]|nr:nodulation protein NfeD [Chloroflexota bacterium]
MARRIGRFLFAVPILLGVLGLVAGAPARAAAGEVIVLSATGPVESILAEYLEQGIVRAGTDRANAVVIRIDTPGGRLDATERIVSALLDAPIPTIVWVAPPGARAASAGTFITLAGHVALMAPGTNIGAASPIDASGEDIPGTLGQKIKNDAIASIRAIAEARGRNADWAAATVAEAKSSPAS